MSARCFAVALLSLALAACPAAPAAVRHDFGSFAITVPASWKAEVFREAARLGVPVPGGRPVVSGVRFTGPGGEFLSIHDESFGLSGVQDADAWWTLAPGPEGGVAAVEVSPPCRRDETVPEGAPSCLAGDGKLEALAHLRVGGGWELRFGQLRRERAEDLAPFADILRTLRAR